MGKIIVSDNMSLDGVIQDPAGDEGFDRGGWVGLIKDRPDLARLALDEALGSEAMLMGLIRSSAADAHLGIEGVTDFASDTASTLALLLRAKHGAKLDAGQMERLGLIVRGGAGLQPPLRIQASWIYGKLTGQDKVYLASVLSD